MSSRGTGLDLDASHNLANSPRNGVASNIVFSQAFKFGRPIVTYFWTAGKYRYRQFQKSSGKLPRQSGRAYTVASCVVNFPRGMCFQHALESLEMTHMSPSLRRKSFANAAVPEQPGHQWALLVCKHAAFDKWHSVAQPAPWRWF